MAEHYVPVSRDTMRLLRMMSKQSGKSYDELIRELVLYRDGMPTALLAAHPEHSPWTRTDRDQTDDE